MCNPDCRPCYSISQTKQLDLFSGLQPAVQKAPPVLRGLAACHDQLAQMEDSEEHVDPRVQE